MASTQMAPVSTPARVIFNWKARPCIVLGEAEQERPRIGGKFRGVYTVVRVRFIDGLQPAQGMFGKQTWGKKATQIRGAQADFWRRVDELVAGDGLTPERARQQAMAEHAKGIGRNPE